MKIKKVNELTQSPKREDGFYWVPQQLWRLKPQRYGVWTVCLHPNSMNSAEIDSFEYLLASDYFHDRIISLKDVMLTPRRKGMLDWLYGSYFWLRIFFFNQLGRMRTMLKSQTY